MGSKWAIVSREGSLKRKDKIWDNVTNRVAPTVGQNQGAQHPIPKGFSIILLKPYVKSVTHSEKLEWWIISMVECVTIFYVHTTLGRGGGHRSFGQCPKFHSFFFMDSFRRTLLFTVSKSDYC